MNRTSLATVILELLRRSGPLRATEIADRLAREPGTSGGDGAPTKTDVNQLLYGELRGRVVQDSRYRWSLADGRPKDAAAARPARAASGHRSSEVWKRFDRLVAYYLNCLKEEQSEGARTFLSDLGRKYLAFPRDEEWAGGSAQTITVRLGEAERAFAGTLRQAGQRAALLYGYPLAVQWIERSRSGWTGGFAIPVFLQPVQFDFDGGELRLDLEHDWPRLNPEFANLALPSKEDLQSFLDELGLLDLEAEPPEDGLSDIVRRLSSIGAPMEVLEPLVPDRLAADPPPSALDRQGIYNRAVLMIGERSKFTKGLEYELGKLHGVDEAELGLTALRHFFETGGSPNTTTVTKRASTEPTDDLVEVVPLNDEQRQAVVSAFERPLTVVTGPPGTGKSQVIVSILANAYLRGQRILFTSRNNKAVDVVEARVNALSGHPLVVRTGSRAGDRNLRAELLQFLIESLALSPSDEERTEYRRVGERLERLAEERQNLWETLEAMRRARNFADELDRELGPYRNEIDPEAWRRIYELSEVPTVPGLDRALSTARRQADPRAGWPKRIGRWLTRSRDFAVIERVGEILRSHMGIFDAPPAEAPSVENVGVWHSCLASAARRVEAIRRCREFRTAMERLRDLPTTEVLADRLASLEERISEQGALHLSLHARLLPDRLDSDLRRRLGEFRATLERLNQDQLGGQTYARLMSAQEKLFRKISRVLPAWCVTNLSARGSLPFDGGLFDLVVIDEASQCDIPSALPLLYRSSRAVVIGDPNQLRHIASLHPQRDQQLQGRHDLATAENQPYTFIQNSLFDLATTVSGDAPMVSLREHFRSHADIIQFSNRKWYKGTLRVCTDYRRLRGIDGMEPGIRWSRVESRISRPSGGGALAENEAIAVVDELQDLLGRRAFRGTVGIVTPFRAQANRLRDLVNQRIDLSQMERSELIVDTAHGFQGDERDVILFSPCMGREMPRGARFFLSKTGNLFNVAITRARSLLHVVGDWVAATSCGIPHIEEFAQFVEQIPDAEGQSQSGAAWDSPWEKTFYKALLEAGLDPLPQYVVHQYRLDLAVLRGGMKLDLEVDGELYHKEWDGTRARRDVIRDLRLAALGWTVKRFWVYQLRDEIDQCVEDVAKLVHETSVISRCRNLPFAR